MGFQITSSYVKGDPYLSNVSLLLRTDGVNIVDDSRADNQIILNNNPIVDTSIKKYSPGSIYFNGSNYLSIPSRGIFDFKDNDFTIEMWVYNGGGDNREFVAKNRANEPFYGAGSFTMRISFEQRLYFGLTSDSTNNGWETESLSTNSIPLNTWSHVAATRSGSTVRTFINGNLETTGTFSGSVEFNNNPLLVAALYYHVPPIVNLFTGNIEDLRITNGVCRYTDSFSTPDSAYPQGQY
jgi:hypothetical protein